MKIEKLTKNPKPIRQLTIHAIRHLLTSSTRTVNKMTFMRSYWYNCIISDKMGIASVPNDLKFQAFTSRLRGKNPNFEIIKNCVTPQKR